MKKLKALCMLFATLMTLGLCTLFGSVYCQAADTEIVPADTMAAAPSIDIGSDYFAKMDNRIGYVKFTTPADGGYVTVYYKNITIPTWAHGYVKTSTGETLKSADKSSGNSATWEFLSEPGLRNEAVLEPATTYYIQVGHATNTGNVKFSVNFVADANPNGKDQAEQINLNTSYTRSIDAADQDDHDYFKFTTGSGGTHSVSISKTGKNYFCYSIRNWSTDELVKTTSGSDFKNDFSGSSIKKEITLEANTTYYLQVWDEGIQTYTFSISNQTVTSISIPSSKTLAQGESFNLNPTILPELAFNKEVSYSSSNSDICYVSNSGKVSASSSKCGVATITVTAKDGSQTKATCKVYVAPSTASTPYVASYSGKAHTIRWNAQTGVAGYVVYVKSGKQWKALATTTSTSYTRTGLKSGQKCQYRICSFIEDGTRICSQMSGICYAATKPTFKIKNIKVKRTKKKTRYAFGAKRYYATISWSRNKKASAYSVYYSVGSSKAKRFLKTVKGKSLKVNFYQSSSSSMSRTRYYYVKPVITYKGKTYDGSYSKSKRYKHH